MLSIESVRFDTSGWSLAEQSPTTFRWSCDRPQVLSLQYFAMPPNIPCDLSDLKTLRDFYRVGITEAGGGIVSIDIVALKSIRAIKSIFKAPNQPTGSVYIGSLTIPFAHASLVIKIQSAESGITGQRETAVKEYLVLENLIQQDPATKELIGFSQDPYDPTFKGPFLRNQADDLLYDEHFPDHPLSQTRATLKKVEDTIEFDHDVMIEPAFLSGAFPTSA
jgi:hypothetical protein